MIADRFLILLICVVLANCRKDMPIPVQITVEPQKEKVTEYYPLAVGNYWIYHVYKIDTDKIEYYEYTDTVSILKDTIMKGRKYFLKKSFYYSSTFKYWVADSADYIIDDKGFRFLTHSNFNDTFYIYTQEGLWTDYCKMFNRYSLITVPAGTFTTIEREALRYFHFQNPAGNPIVSTSYFAKGIGLVKARFIAHNFGPEMLESKLIKYKLIK